MPSTLVRPRPYRWDRILGVVFMLGGAVFLFIGLTGSGAPIEDPSKAAGTYHHETVLYLLAGLAAVTAGAILVLMRPMR